MRPTILCLLIVSGASVGCGQNAATSNRSGAPTNHVVDGLVVRTASETATLSEIASVQQSIRKNEDDVKNSLTTLDGHLREQQSWSVERERAAMAELSRLVPLMIQEAKWLKENNRRFADHLTAYRSSLSKAAELYLNAGGIYDRYAEEETDRAFKGLYEDLAKKCKALAPVMTERATSLEPIEAAVKEKVAYVDRSLLFLERLQDFIKLYENTHGNDSEVQAYLGRLTEYITNFESMIGSLKVLCHRMATDPVPAVTIRAPKK